MQQLILIAAQGFGVGRIPFAPGTFGSLLGMLWFLVLFKTQSVPLFVSGILLGLAVSVWLASQAEKLLGEKDPSSVVIDEIAVMPICFLPWFIAPPNWSFRGNVCFAVAVFVLFRVFDIAKVPPADRLEKLSGGWGITADDTMAALYVAIVTIPIIYYIPGAS